MWERRTFYECANELITVSKDFRNAFINSDSLKEPKRNQILHTSSKRGIEILRTLALSIRTEQDYGSIPDSSDVVGSLKSMANDSDLDLALNHYRPPFNNQTGFSELGLRDALNKVAHSNNQKSGFYADEFAHDIILTGLSQNRKHTWVAIISLIELCRVIKSIPDYEYDVSEK